MKILINANTKQNLSKENFLGGIEILNYDLFNYLKKKHEVVLVKNINKKIQYKKWDIIILVIGFLLGVFNLIGVVFPV